MKYVSLFYYYDSLQVIAEGEVTGRASASTWASSPSRTAAALAVFRKKDLVR